MKKTYEIKNSSCIKQFTYDSETKVLNITFKNNPVVYDYPDVPQEDVNGFISSESKGKYFNRVIKKYGVR
jgi:hypothetical protein